MFQKLKQYINLNRGTTNKVQTSRATGVPMEVIEKFIEDGRLELKYGSIGFQSSNSKRMSDEKRRELAEALYSQMNNDSKNSSSTNKNSGSQLVTDLKGKYRSGNRDER